MPNLSLVGKAVEGDADGYWLNLYEHSSNLWMCGEDNNASKLSVTKQGSWIYKVIPDRGVAALEVGSEQSVVFFFRNLNPATATVGSTGLGYALEKARGIDWRVVSL
jgi:hypothetical protein